MAIDPILMNALLSLDAYNRGYGAGIAGLSDVIGTRIGNAEIVRGTEADDAAAVNAGFYAIAYNLDGQRIVSYRGTNAEPLSALIADALNGYGVAGGSPFGPQASLAIDFYDAVLNGADPRTANVAFTGHSLGGGLAGFVAAIYGKSGILFDNMTFNTAAANAASFATQSYNGFPLPGFEALSAELLQSVYGNQQPWANNLSGLSAYAVTGELIHLALPLRLTQTPAVQYMEMEIE
jgi:hypothetical protein